MQNIYSSGLNVSLTKRKPLRYKLVISTEIMVVNNCFLILHTGSVFLGPWTPESVGDYASGTNHVLPTYGYARMYSGVSLDSFMKHITVQSLTEEGLRNLGPHVATMAEVEGLDAHKRAVTLRLQDIEANQTPNIR